MDQGEPYSASDFQFDLTSSSGASSTDTGNDGNRWSGTATEIATISVTSESYHEKESIQVTALDLGSFPALSAQAACYRGWPRALWGSLLLA